MTTQQVFSVCGMCTVRCPIMAEVKNDNVQLLQGNPHVPAMKGTICPKGAAGIALLHDHERIQGPMIREGKRGEGKWRQVSWDEALEETAARLKAVMDKHGARSVAFSDRSGPFKDLHQAFVRGLGSPNYTNHDSSCARNVHHACISVTGAGREELVYDYKNARHVVFQTRNIFEAINVQEVTNLTAAMDAGCKITVIDIRATISATKADRFLLVRPGSDYALNLAVIHELLFKKLYDAEYAARWINDLGQLEEFVRPYSPEWAEGETGVPAGEIRRFVQEIAAARPAVIWHPGWMTARYTDSFYVSRTAYIINALLGSIGARGGLMFTKKPGDVGRKGLNKLADLFPKPTEKRADGVGWLYKHFDAGPGLAHLVYKAMETGEPYPVKAYIAYRHDPLMGFPDPDRLRQIFDHLDLLVSVSFTWSDTAWYSDIVLPLSTYLERESIMACKNGLRPYFFVRRRAVQPRFDTRADWEIICGLARRLGIGELAFSSIEDIWNYQLEGTGVRPEDFNATGFVNLAQPVEDPPFTEPRFKTPSGKIDIISERLEKQGIPSLKPYTAPKRPPKGQFRLTFGRCAVHTQGHTVNNPMLSELMSENVLWINDRAAAELQITDGERVTVSRDGYSETIRAKVTPLIHPEAVFVVHGFGHRLPVESRAYGKGLADNCFMQGGLEIWDQAGGSIAMQEHFVTVSKC
ncbi:molybdopterin-containing oxidoreductase family protein [Desulfallas thermosapovorans]|uniref:Monomeric thiosulfate reductase apoprotein n=1 Tax=Desulfallas thermosapovorans DSM 6562 TaxID=1121431 RepID=A0A5S4ZVN9_9FIRM|nr:molybdopterin-dependent oxidoreductase [Desulfallas thermosapovorans]TYO96866.1 monomeric thiosulfate reductase apoprotein [Desulfallas thermosapovorans DSM 6562]